MTTATPTSCNVLPAVAQGVMRWTLVALACVVTTTWSLPKAAAAQGDATLPKPVLDGGIVTSSHPHPGTKVKRGRAEALIDAPLADVLKVVEGYGRYKDFLPKFEKSQVLSQRGASALVYLQLGILNGASTAWAQVKFKKTEGATHVIEGTMTKGNVKQLMARWEVRPYSATQTFVAFELLVDPDLPLPASLVSGEVEKMSRRVVRAVRQELAAKR